MLDCLGQHFPEFVVRFGPYIEEIQPPLTRSEIHKLEADLGVPLPESFKLFLECTSGFRLDSPMLNFHPGLIRFEFSPTSLFFGEYFKEADGDSVFFDVSQGLQDGEYPVHYYCHEDRPPTTWQLAVSFKQWLEELER